MRNLFLKFIVLIFASLSIVANADETETLKLGVNTAYPSNINTVGQGLMYVLAVTDYKLALGYPASTSALEIMGRPIPPEAIHDSVMPVYQAILLLIGTDSRLVVDNVHKLVTIEKYIGEGR